MSDAEQLTANEASEFRPGNQRERPEHQDEIEPQGTEVERVARRLISIIEPSLDWVEQCRIDQHCEQGAGNGHRNVRDPHDERINSAAKEPGSGTERNPQEQADHRGDGGHQCGRPCTEEQSAKDVPAEGVCPEPVVGRWPLETPAGVLR